MQIRRLNGPHKMTDSAPTAFFIQLDGNGTLSQSVGASQGTDNEPAAFLFTHPNKECHRLEYAQIGYVPVDECGVECSCQQRQSHISRYLQWLCLYTYGS